MKVFPTCLPSLPLLLLLLLQCQLTHEMEELFEKIVHHLHPHISIGRVCFRCAVHIFVN